MEAEIQGKKCQGQNYHALHQKLHTMGVPNSVSNRGCHKIANAVDSGYNKTEYNKLRIVCINFGGPFNTPITTMH